MIRAISRAACVLTLAACSHGEPAPAQSPAEPTVAVSSPLAACDEYVHLYDTCLAKSDATEGASLRAGQGAFRARVEKGPVMLPVAAAVDTKSARLLAKLERMEHRKPARPQAHPPEKADDPTDTLVRQCKSALETLPRRCK